MFTYNTSLETIKLRAYGRHIQSLIEKVKKNPNKEQRTKYVDSIMHLMKKIDGNSENKEEQNLQIWNDVMVMADYDLDVNNTYPIPEKAAKRKPTKLAYQVPNKEFKCFSRYLVSFIKIIGKEIGKDSAKDEKIIPLLIRWAHSFRKKDDAATLLQNIEEIMGKSVTITPSIKGFLAKRLTERRRSNHNNRNTRKR